MTDQSGRLAALAQNVEVFDARLAEVCEDLDANGGRERRFADKITRAKRDNQIDRLSDNLKSVARIVSNQRSDLNRALQKNTDLETKCLDVETENQTLRNSRGDSSELRREKRKNQTLEAKLLDLETELATLRNAGSDSTELLRERRKVRDLSNTNSQLEDRLEVLQRENRNLRNNQQSNNNHRNNFQWFQDQIDSLKLDNTTLETKVTRLETEKADETAKKNEYKKKVKDVTKEKDELKEKNDEMFQRYDKSIWGSRNPNCVKCQRNVDHYCGGHIKPRKTT